MLLAAGHGTRMAPLTPRWPKPALPVLDEPVVLRLVRSLAEQGVESIVVNAHRDPGPLRDALRRAPIPVDLSLEPQLRGSGGGILQARGFLEGPAPFLVLNADMCIDLDVEDLARAHERSGSMATLLLRDDPRNRQFGTIGYAKDGGVCRITDSIEAKAEAGCGLFTGVHMMESAIFEHMPQQPEFDIIRELYLPWMRAGERIGTRLQARSATWWPVGCPGELLDANLAALAQKLEARRAQPDAVIAAEDAVLEGEVRGPAWLGAGVRIEADACVGPRVVIGAQARVQSGARLEESLLLPGALLPSREPLRRAIGFGEAVWLDD